MGNEGKDMGREGKKDEIKGRAKKATGEVTGDDKLKREGTVDKTKGKIKQTADKAKDKVQGDDN